MPNVVEVQAEWFENDRNPVPMFYYAMHWSHCYAIYSWANDSKQIYSEIYYYFNMYVQYASIDIFQKDLKHLV